MGTTCRLCLEPCDFNDRLSDRNFREKTQDILVLHLKINEENISIVCDSCKSQIESFYQFKWKCRKNEALRRNPNATVTSTGYADIVPPRKPKRTPRDPNEPKKSYYKRLTNRSRWTPFTKEQLALKSKDEWRKERSKKICEICGKVQANNGNMEAHMNRHRGIRPYGCDEPDCEAKFSNMVALEQHKKRMHTNEHHPCPECGKVFTSAITLRNHRIIHQEKSLACEICSFKCRMQYSMKKHMLVHTQQRNYKCQYCDKAFYANTVLTLHLRQHTGERPYACHVCDFSHAHRILYVKHMQKAHPGEETRTLAEMQRLAAIARAQQREQNEEEGAVQKRDKTAKQDEQPQQQQQQDSSD